MRAALHAARRRKGGGAGKSVEELQARARVDLGEATTCLLALGGHCEQAHETDPSRDDWEWELHARKVAGAAFIAEVGMALRKAFTKTTKGSKGNE